MLFWEEASCFLLQWSFLILQPLYFTLEKLVLDHVRPPKPTQFPKQGWNILTLVDVDVIIMNYKWFFIILSMLVAKSGTDFNMKLQFYHLQFLNTQWMAMAFERIQHINMN